MLTGPITTVSQSPTPAAGRRPTGRAAIATKEVLRPETSLAALQKTEAADKTPGDALHPLPFSATLKWAHGIPLAASLDLPG